MRKVSVALVHFPILDRRGQKVCTNITNFDLHDIARACRTFGVEEYFLIHPMKEQLSFASRVMGHWKTGYGMKFNPMRSTALGMVSMKESLFEAINSWHKEALVLATAARSLNKKTLSFKEIKDSKNPLMLVFGTGFGLHTEALSLCHGLLEPIRGSSKDDYRHLSVRSAVSICLDRLLGKW